MDPYWMYRVKDGAVESKLFTSKKEPKGWLDSNKAAKYELANGKPMELKEEEIDLLTSNALAEGTLELIEEENLSDDNSSRDSQSIS